MSATLIRKILLKMPRPHTLRLKVADEVQMMTIPPSPHWAEIAETIDNLDPELIEVLDSKGGLLRSAKSDQFDDQLVEDKQVASRAAQTRVAFDAETERFKLVASLIADAYKWGNEVAWGKLVALFETVVTMGETKERTIGTFHKLVEKLYQENAQLAAESGVEQDPMTQMMGAFLAGQMQGTGARTPAPTPAGVAAAAIAASAKPTNGASKASPTTKVRAKA